MSAFPSRYDSKASAPAGDKAGFVVVTGGVVVLEELDVVPRVVVVSRTPCSLPQAVGTIAATTDAAIHPHLLIDDSVGSALGQGAEDQTGAGLGPEEGRLLGQAFPGLGHGGDVVDGNRREV